MRRAMNFLGCFLCLKYSSPFAHSSRLADLRAVIPIPCLLTEFCGTRFGVLPKHRLGIADYRIKFYAAFKEFSEKFFSNLNSPSTLCISTFNIGYLCKVGKNNQRAVASNPGLFEHRFFLCAAVVSCLEFIPLKKQNFKVRHCGLSPGFSDYSGRRAINFH